MGTEAVAAGSGAIARVQFGESGPYLTLMSELRQQLLVLESAVAVARATAEPERDLFPDNTAPALLRAAALIEAVDASLGWVHACEMLTSSFPAFFDEVPRWVFADPKDELSSLKAARGYAETAVERFDQLEANSPEGSTAKTMIARLQAAAGKAEKLALKAHMRKQRVREGHDAGKPVQEVNRAAKGASSQGEAVRLKINELIGDRAVIKQSALALLPTLAYGPGEDLPILKIKQESPLEIVVILIGSAGALVAVLNGLLDVQIKYKTRKEKERAERSRLERELAEDEAKTEAMKKLRVTLSAHEPPQLKMQEFAVFDSLEEAFEDDEEMRAT